MNQIDDRILSTKEMEHEADLLAKKKHKKKSKGKKKKSLK